MTRPTAQVNTSVRNGESRDPETGRITPASEAAIDQSPKKRKRPIGGPTRALVVSKTKSPAVGQRTGLNQWREFDRVPIKTSSLGELGLLDYFFLEARGHLLIFEEFHAETPFALRHAAQIVRVAKHLGERDFGRDYGVTRA
jgi:hypothetical protein